MSIETFARYLVRVSLARKGFTLGTVPEAKPLADACDMVLTRSDGMSFEILCLIDREAAPARRFTLPPALVRDIGDHCQHYTGTINRARMPVIIRLMEIGGTATAEDRGRLKAYGSGLFATKVKTSAWALDPANAEVWTTSPLGGWFTARWLRALMRAPREADIVAQEPAILRPPVFPALTWTLLAVLAGVFALEQVYGLGAGGSLLAPTIRTLMALGGLSAPFVFDDGQWYRLVSAMFLHGSAFHLLMNAIALYYAGSVLERLVGRAWLATLFFLGGLCGSALSLTLNPASTVSVGASGAIMALAAATFLLSFRMPQGGERLALQTNLAQVLIPALIPLAGAAGGHKVDFAAHLGGALGGAVLGWLLLRAWPRAQPLPRLRPLAAAIAGAGLCVTVATAALVANGYGTFALSARMIPQADMPKSDSEAKRQSADLVARFPEDPRARLFRGLALAEANDLPAAERELRTGLALPAATDLYDDNLRWRLRFMLSVLVGMRGDRAEARTIAAPLCTASDSGVAQAATMRATLAKQGLCG